MIKKILRKIRNVNGSALLVALLVMGVLLSISLALSALVFRELRITKDMMSSGRAYYAAESGIEIALYRLNSNLPGWEPGDEAGSDGWVPIFVGDEAVAEYSVNNTCRTYPCFDDYDTSNITGDLQQLYGVLDLNEAVNIPLFIVKGENNVVPVGDFVIYFFTNFNPKTDIAIEVAGPEGFTSWELLRWKVYGLRGTNGDIVTESISDKAAVFTANVTTIEGTTYTNTNAEFPSWFGSINCVNIADGDKTMSAIKCAPIGGKNPIVQPVSQQISHIYRGTCDVWEAREYYDYTKHEKLEVEDIYPCYPISGFLDSHRLNYLSITNMMNPVVLDHLKYPSEEGRADKSRVYYRIEFYENDDRMVEMEGVPETTNKVVRDFADIKANGYSGNAKQSVNVKMKKGSLLPVFNFSLYSTHKNE